MIYAVKALTKKRGSRWEEMSTPEPEAAREVFHKEVMGILDCEDV